MTEAVVGARKRGRISRLASLVLGSAALMLAVASAPAQAAPPLGMMWSETYGSAEDWAVINKSGADIFRLPINTKETKYGEDFSKYDTIFALAAKGGIRILPVLDGRMDGKEGLPEKSEEKNWSAWAREAVCRYGYNGTFWAANPTVPALPVQAWEIWNEPNEITNGEEYGKFLAWAGPAVQAASESASCGKKPTGVIFGAMMAKNMDTAYQAFFTNAVAKSGAGAFTGVGFHPYELNPAKLPEGKRLQGLKNAVTAIRWFLDGKAEWKGKSLWVTEYGWPVERENAISEDEQVKLLRESVDWFNSNEAILDLKAVVWYNYRDSFNYGTQWQYRCGMRDEVGNFRKSWFAFQEKAGAARWPIATTAFQANTTQLFTQTASASTNTLLGMKAGTSPSIGQKGGSFMVAFQANTGDLYYYTPAEGGKNTGFGMAAGTSPAISRLEGGMIAFQSNAGQLWYVQPGGIAAVNTEQAMAAGTSPSVTRIHSNGNWLIAYQGPDTKLRILEVGGAVTNTGAEMMPGTSPSIAAINHEKLEPTYAVAYQGAGSSLGFYLDGKEPVSTPYGMKAGTSPGIASLPTSPSSIVPAYSRFEAVFQANTTDLWIYQPYGTVAATPYGMQAGSSPSVAAISDGVCCASPSLYRQFKIGFHAGTGSLWTYEPGGAVTNTLLGNAANTSPSIAPG